MILTLNDITDTSFARDFSERETERAKWLANGLAYFAQLCKSYSIDESKIPDDADAPYIPKRIATICVLIACFRDNLGSDFRAVSESYNLDIYKQKLDIAQKELDGLLVMFTPSNCGYTPDPATSTESTNTMSFEWVRG